MEVSTVSPPPASATEGDDLCDTDVTNVAIHSVTLIICLCGLAGNGAVLRLLTLKVRNAPIFDVAVTDFLFLLFAVPSTLLFLLNEVSCSPIMPQVYVSIIFQLSMVSCYWGLFRLTRIKLTVDMDKLCLLCCCCNLPRRLWLVVESALYWAIFALFTAIPTVTFLCPSYQQQHCLAALISIFTIILLLFAAPVVIACTIDFIKAKCGSQQQQPERRDVVIFLIVLFSLFISLWNFLQQLGYTVVPSQVVFLLTCINSTIKPIIYFLAGRCWSPCSVRTLRESLQRVFEEQKDNTVCSNDTNIDTGLSLLIPPTLLMEDPGTVAERFLEPMD